MTPIENMLLREPDVTFIEQILEFRRKMAEAGSSMEGCGPLLSMDNAVLWMREVDLLRRRETVPAHHHQTTQFIYVREESHEVVGMIQVVHDLNEAETAATGNVTFSVVPSERRKGYGKEMLRRCLRFCHRIGMGKVTLVCGEKNTGARKVILENGGTLVTPSGAKASSGRQLYQIDLASIQPTPRAQRKKRRK